MPSDRDPLITGIGLITCLGEGEEAHLAALDSFVPIVDVTTFAPYPVHPMTALALDTQIPKRGDQRQMEPWQRIGVYAAGLALDQAKVKGDTALLERMDMIVAAGGGERDYAVDAAILAAMPKADDPDVYLNEHLLSDLRPTLFLAQLSNLLAGNISIVHGVIGSSRTFMGEEASGADALRIACARIQAGQSEICLAGGSFNAQRPDTFLHHAMGHALRRGGHAPVWARQAEGGGAILGSVGCFLVIESRAHALARGVIPKACIAGIETDRCGRAPGEAAASAARQAAALGNASAVISGASGAARATAEEREFLDRLGLPVRAVASAIGHSLEPSFPAAVALAAMSIARRKLFPPLEPAEAPFEGQLAGLLVTSWGMWRGEATALVTPA
ncbi:MAG: beta-ketoacyl-ACP synthase [Acetobacteraceae bacterium]|nr:beta-ketoacyl-ACP synthase [Acetobacteraceae bacterium]